MLAIWGSGITLGLFGLWSYAQAAGEGHAPPNAADAYVQVSPSGYTLVMAVHPKCPCSVSSAFELQRLMARGGDELSVQVLVYQPSDSEEAWEVDDPFGLAGIGGLRVIADPDGAQAAALGCLTSGSVVLFNSSGEPEFWGGITSGRGHAGDNLGSDSVLAVLAGEEPRVGSTPVYGCAITDSPRAQECCQAEKAGCADE